jgi:uncharacterized protein (DUF58 family)
MTWIWRQLYRQYRFLTWLHFASRRRLTRTGWVLLVCLIITLLMGVNLDKMVSYQAFSLLLFLWVSAILSSFFFRTKISVTRSLPRFGTVGQPLYSRVTVKNLTDKLQLDLSLLEDLADPRPSFPEWLALKKAEEQAVRSFRPGTRLRTVSRTMGRVRAARVPALPPGREVEVLVEVTPLRRGNLNFTGVTLARADPFGLFWGFVRFRRAGKMVVLPKRYPLPPVALPGVLKYQDGGVALAAHVGQSDEFVALRDYRRGDPLRHIHWRSWARTGKPIVKEFEDEFFVRHALVLDTFSNVPDSELFEEAVSVAASFACTIPTQESLLDLLFVGAEAYCFTAGRGLAHADQMLEILASVRLCTEAPFSALEGLVLNHSAMVSNCICIFLAWDEPRRGFVQKLRASGVPVRVLVLVAEPPRQPLDPGPLREEPGSFHTLVLGQIEAGLQEI